MKNEKSIQIQSSISPQQQTLHYSKANFREQGAEIIADTVRKKLHAECKSVLQIKYMHLNINVTPWRITPTWQSFPPWIQELTFIKISRDIVGTVSNEKFPISRQGLDKRQIFDPKCSTVKRPLNSIIIPNSWLGSQKIHFIALIPIFKRSYTSQNSRLFIIYNI